MRLYQLDFAPLSPFTSQISSYTLFGAICWGYKLLFGENSLISLLDQFHQSPPFLISSVLLKDENTIYFPCPQMIDNFDEPKNELEYKFQKQLKKLGWIPKDALIEFLNGKITSKKDLGKYLRNRNYVIEEIKDNKSHISIKLPKIEKINRVRNSINRLTWTTTGGELINTLCYHYPEFSIFLLVYDEKFDIEIIKKIFELVSICGDKSVGYGRVKLKNIFENEEFNKYLQPGAKSEFMYLLSPSFPDSAYEYESSLYNLRIFIGKVDNFYERLSAPILKKKVIYLEAGSVMKIRQAKNFYGNILPVIESYRYYDPSQVVKIYQYGYAFPLYIQLP